MKHLTQYDDDELYGLDADEIDELCIENGIERYDGDDEISTISLVEKLVIAKAEKLAEGK